MPSIEKAVGLTLIVLVMAFIFPAVLTAADDGRTEDVDSYTESEVKQLEQALVVEATDISPNGVTVNVTSVESSDGEMVTLTEAESATVTIDGTDVMIEAVDLTGDSATIRVTYATTLGWSAPAERMSGLLPLAILVAGFVAIVMVGGAMIR